MVLEEGDTADCTACHGVPGEEERMAIQPAPSESCLTCHTHEAPDHLAENRDCAACHVELAEARALTVEQIEAWPQPATHESADFQATHGAMATAESADCAFCHAEESCTRCHVNGDALDPIRSLPSDTRIATILADDQPEYVEPANHDSQEWGFDHAELALSEPAGCANCHTEPSCRSCHTGVGPDAVSDLPRVAEGDPRGVQLSSAMPVHEIGFAGDHGAMAAASEASCFGCHTEDTCTDCHDGPGGGFHQPNFLQMHGADAYGSQSDCASCHSTEVFCRACHNDTGLGSQGRLRTAFHSAQPLWLLGHGNAARQGMESCASCHRQVDCMRCHSAVGSWRISPHGPDFDGDLSDRQNIASCALCHRGGP